MSLVLASSFSELAKQHTVLLHHAAFVCQAAATSLLAAAWQAGLLVVCVAVILRTVPHLDAATRSAAWTAVLLVSLALPFAPLLGSSDVRGVPSYETQPKHLDPHWSFALAGTWLLLSLLRMVSLGSSATRLYQLGQRATPVIASALMLPAAVRKASRHASICTSDEVTRPSVLGFFSPRILIPAHLYRTLAPSELEQIVLHESEHLRRYDDWRNLLQKLALVLFPLNPALFWVERRLCREREMACDERVLRTTLAPKSYASCLVHLAEQSMLGSRLSLELGAWERRSELARRVHQILGRHGRPMSRAQGLAFSVLLGTGLASGAAALSKAPPLFSFTAQPSPSSTAELHPAADLLAAEVAPSSEQSSSNPPRLTLVSASLPLIPRAHRNTPSDNRNSRPQSAHKSPRTYRIETSAAMAVLTSWNNFGKNSGKDFGNNSGNNAGVDSRLDSRSDAWSNSGNMHANSRTPQPVVSTPLVASTLTAPGIPQTRLVPLAATDSLDLIQPRLIFTVETETGNAHSVSTYAAVPTDSGWLILQL